MLSSQGEETRDAGKRADRGSEGSEEARMVVQALCDCSVRSSSFVVHTCPVCVGVVVRAIKEAVSA